MTTTTAPTIQTGSRQAVLAAFFINGAVLANWVSRIPQIQDDLAMSKSVLGIVLLGMAAGVLTALSVASGLIARCGSRTVTVTAGVMICLMLPVLAWMPNPLTLGMALYVIGTGVSTMDVAMNAQAVEVETLAQRPLMSTFHAAFSIGGVVGAGIGAGMAALDVSPRLHFALAALLFLLMLVVAARYLLPVDPAERDKDPEPVFQLPRRALWGLGIVALAAAISEGAMADWSGLYLNEVVGTDKGIAALGFAFFSAAMTVGRLSGDAITTRFSPARVVQIGGAVAFAGLLLAIVAPYQLPTLIGFAAVGIGLATAVPLAFSTAGKLPDVSPSAGIAGVATIGYAGFLVGPPVIGLVADATSLRFAMLLIALLSGTLVFTARSLRLPAANA